MLNQSTYSLFKFTIIDVLYCFLWSETDVFKSYLFQCSKTVACNHKNKLLQAYIIFLSFLKNSIKMYNDQQKLIRFARIIQAP